MESANSGPCYWARLKPYNPQRGCKLQRCHYLGRVWTGGDGIWEIPEWVEVNAAQAVHLKVLRQSGFTQPQSAMDTAAFDIVTPEMKQIIDQRETELRMRARGIGAASVTSMPDFNPTETKSSAPAARRVTMEDLENAPPPAQSIVEKQDPLLSIGDDGDDASALSDDTVGSPVGAHHIQAMRPEEVSISGRTAAAEGFEQDSGMDLNDGLDVDDVAPAVNDADYGDAPSIKAEAPTDTELPPAPPPKVRSARTSRGRTRRGRGK